MIRTPLRTVYTKNVTSTSSSTDTVVLPFSDFDSLVAKFVITTLNTGLSGTLNLYVQTTDDAGTTYYDACSFTQVTEATTMTNAAAKWAPLNNSTGLAYTASASDATLSAGSLGIPLLSNQVRIKWVYNNTGTSTAVANWTISLLANNQSPHS